MPTRRDKWIIGLPAAVVLSIVLAEAAPPTAADPPDTDFLEFLGSWTSGDEQPKWIDPFQLDDPVLFEPDQQDDQRLPRDRRDELRQKQRNDDNHSREPSPSSVRPGGGMKP
jgi:hypothetical protein